MADTKVTGLSELTEPDGLDLIYVVDDPGGSPASKKATLQNALAGALGASQLVNEVMNWPANVGIDLDLVAANQWWDSVATPSTAATMVDVAGEAGITESYEYALKCVADGSGDGLYQRYTYADQPRLKSGVTVSAIAAVWVGTAGRTVTMTLANQDSGTTTATATAQAWTIIKAEGHTCSGTYLDLQFTVDGASDVYVVPLGLCIGAKAFPLPARGLRYVEKYAAAVVNNVDPGAAWTDLDLTSSTSALAAMAIIHVNYMNTSAAGPVYLRRNGDSGTGAAYEVGRSTAASVFCSTISNIVLDDGQICEFVGGSAGLVEQTYMNLRGYLEWA